VEICRHNSGIDILYDAGALVLAPPFAFRRHAGGELVDFAEAPLAADPGGELVDFAEAPLAADPQMKECLRLQGRWLVHRLSRESPWYGW